MNYSVYLGQNAVDIKTATIYPTPYHRNQVMEYVQFTAQYPTYITVRSEIPVEKVQIRPLSLKLEPELIDGQMRIYLEKPVKFSLEINGSFADNLLVLAEEERYDTFLADWEKKKREGQPGSLVYFAKGIHEEGVLSFTESDTTIYLEEGAFIHGKIDLDHCDRVTICGYGIICMEKYPYEMRHTYQRCINAMYCKELTIRDITITDSNDWSLRVLGCDNVLVDNVKIVGCRGNSDGVDICGSRNVLVQNVFTRVWDDSLVVKALDTGNVENVTFRSCILWNDFARPMEVGVELRADKVKNVRFENIDVLHSPTGYPLMGIHHGDRAVVSDIVWEDIRIEDAPGAQLFDIRITPSYWNRDDRMGCIRDVTFRNIRVAGKPGIQQLLSDSRLQGYDAEHDIRGVTFENVEVMGKTIHDAESCGLLCRNDVQDVTFVSSPDADPLQMIETKLGLTKEFRLTQSGAYEGEVTVSFRNRWDSPKEKEVWLQISPANTGEYAREPKRITLPPNGEAALVYPVKLFPGKYVLALQSEDPEIRYAWKFLQLDWVLETKKPGREESGRLPGGHSPSVQSSSGQRPSGQSPLPIVNYYGDRLGSMSIRMCGEKLILHSELLRRQDCQLIVYAAEPVSCQPGEVLFSVEETDFGVVPAVLNGREGPELAPQLRCPLEITLVFKNEPKVKEIRTVEINGGAGEEAGILLEQLGLPADAEHFWLEIEARVPEVADYRYPYTLFHSVTPLTTAHMYGNCRIKEEKR